MDRADKYEPGPRRAFVGPVNIGNPQEVTVLSLAQTIRELCGSKSEIVHHDLPEDDPMRRCPDIIKAQRVLDWQPSVGLQDGLSQTIDWFRWWLADETP